MGLHILVTGFGPFEGHTINASWETVKLLPDSIKGYEIKKEKIIVAYEYVEITIPQLWEKYNPKLVVHVGVSSMTDKITIETCANRKGYVKKDCFGNCHPTGKICTSKEGQDCIFGDIKYNEVCEYINNHECDAEAIISSDAGRLPASFNRKGKGYEEHISNKFDRRLLGYLYRYLCEYTFYSSLKIDKSKTMFVHVPCLNKPYTAQQMSDALTEIIKYVIEHQL